jgi:hypothetical protein
MENKKLILLMFASAISCVSCAINDPGYLGREIAAQIDSFKGEDAEKMEIKTYASNDEITVYEVRGESIGIGGLCYMKRVNFEAKLIDKHLMIDKDSVDEGFELHDSDCFKPLGKVVFFSKEITLSNAQKIFKDLKQIRYFKDTCILPFERSYRDGKQIDINNSRVISIDPDIYKISLLNEVIDNDWLEVLIKYKDSKIDQIRCSRPIGVGAQQSK